MTSSNPLKIASDSYENGLFSNEFEKFEDSPNVYIQSNEHLENTFADIFEDDPKYNDEDDTIPILKKKSLYHQNC
ncbi:MAG: hypothetical protein Satyrvirus31_12 [Satyrvirus sp.]|uniref:Uncharacterized protein n=1 Tax=Satyrvirus sp. TaxID=2487771 RepID=A0A3G5AEY8_9VIRU|nr:MAG: hypothetical protein Satyrvirus31_12 [Satyrvirus sp.]